MHVKYLGCDQYMFGAVLELFVTTCIMPGDVELNLKHLWTARQDAYDSLRTVAQTVQRQLGRRLSAPLRWRAFSPTSLLLLRSTCCSDAMRKRTSGCEASDEDIAELSEI